MKNSTRNKVFGVSEVVLAVPQPLWASWHNCRRTLKFSDEVLTTKECTESQRGRELFSLMKRRSADYLPVGWWFWNSKKYKKSKWYSQLLFVQCGLLKKKRKTSHAAQIKVGSIIIVFFISLWDYEHTPVCCDQHWWFLAKLRSGSLKESKTASWLFGSETAEGQPTSRADEFRSSKVWTFFVFRMEITFFRIFLALCRYF